MESRHTENISKLWQKEGLDIKSLQLYRKKLIWQSLLCGCLFCLFSVFSAIVLCFRFELFCKGLNRVIDNFSNLKYTLKEK